jgi:hypothetical protein
MGPMVTAPSERGVLPVGSESVDGPCPFEWCRRILGPRAKSGSAARPGAPLLGGLTARVTRGHSCRLAGNGGGREAAGRSRRDSSPLRSRADGDGGGHLPAAPPSVEAGASPERCLRNPQTTGALGSRRGTKGPVAARCVLDRVPRVKATSCATRFVSIARRTGHDEYLHAAQPP